MNDDDIDRYFNSDHMTRSRWQAQGWFFLTTPLVRLVQTVAASLARLLGRP